MPRAILPPDAQIQWVSNDALLNQHPLSLGCHSTHRIEIRLAKIRRPGSLARPAESADRSYAWAASTLCASASASMQKIDV